MVCIFQQWQKQAVHIEESQRGPIREEEIKEKNKEKKKPS